ncbi:MAG: 4Fe-4S dicluster domain-containing protein [Deltaproteobacteria bacterium]|nr:4Fe-4S dicluster domain-containing protein [Deltaproteobacteria bacterium]
MVFRVLLYIAIAFFIFGLIYRINGWLTRSIGFFSDEITPSGRLSHFVKSSFRVIFSPRILTLLRVFLVDVIFQWKILKEDYVRWIMHMCIYMGFLMLLLMHALGEIVSASLFSDYYSTLNPFFFLRDLFGIITITGIVIAIFRRWIIKAPRFKTNGMDIYAIIIVALILASGILLEGLKITSHSDFTRMVEEYSDVDNEEDLKALENLWVKEFGLVSPRDMSGPFDEELLKRGVEVHEMNCLGCHSSAVWAFAGYGTARLIRPVALAMDRSKFVGILYILHVLACFFGLAYLPFSKMFHIISTPVCLLVNAVMDGKTANPSNIATKQMIEVDACTHCGTCSRYCSAIMAYESIGNDYILPSEKMSFLKKMAAGRELDRESIRAIQEGVYLCTNCDRCTVVCPSGINLKELWVSVRENLIQRGIPEPLILSPLSFVRGLNQKDFSEKVYAGPIEKARSSVSGSFASLMDAKKAISLPVTDGHVSGYEVRDKTFSHCFGCQNCTTVCPVVGRYEEPQAALGLLPHQIMCCLGLGLDVMASGPGMIWECVTCYQCQEHCPQEVKVTDILYDLKNKAVGNMEKHFATGE